MEELADEFFYKLDYPNLRVVNLPNFIFLCGGAMSDSSDQARPLSDAVENPDTSSFSSQALSMREVLYEQLMVQGGELFGRLKLAEEHQDWLEHGKVKNLIELELALADMAGAIVLLVESVGSYTELGSFSVLEQISDKLIVIVNQKAVHEDTFINLGPIKYLEDNGGNVLRYEWEVKYSITGLNSDVLKTFLDTSNSDVIKKSKLICNKISELLPKLTMKSTILDSRRFGHICFLIAELVFLFSALRLREIRSYLETYFSLNAITESKVKTALYLLEKLDFVTSVSVGEKYFVPGRDNDGFLKYSFESGERNYKNSADLKSSLISYYMENDFERFEAMQEKI